MTGNTQIIDAKSWAMLAFLSLLWGASFMFIGIAVKELPPLLIVFARVSIAATILIIAHIILRGGLPVDRQSWIAGGGMGVINNVIPFLLITWGQQYVASGLASVVNATTPIFTGLFMALFAMEALTVRKTIALVIGVIGVAVLQGADFSKADAQLWGILAIILASASYGISGPWSKKMMQGVAPVSAATCQLITSSAIMSVLAFSFGEVSQYASVSSKTWAAILGLAALSTALAYLIFFNIIKRAGPSFASLCTMVIPVFSILLGYIVLQERLTANELLGAAIIGLALIIIDGRLLNRFTAVPAHRP
jgi:drug/metabolite transporter (DMT)-like permease